MYQLLVGSLGSVLAPLLRWKRAEKTSPRHGNPRCWGSRVRRLGWSSALSLSDFKALSKLKAGSRAPYIEGRKLVLCKLDAEIGRRIGEEALKRLISEENPLECCITLLLKEKCSLAVYSPCFLVLPTHFWLQTHPCSWAPLNTERWFGPHLCKTSL